MRESILILAAPLIVAASRSKMDSGLRRNDARMDTLVSRLLRVLRGSIFSRHCFVSSVVAMLVPVAGMPLFSFFVFFVPSWRILALLFGRWGPADVTDGPGRHIPLARTPGRALQ